MECLVMFKLYDVSYNALLSNVARYFQILVINTKKPGKKTLSNVSFFHE